MRAFVYKRSRKLEGTFYNDPSEGHWGMTMCRVKYGWGYPPEAAMPYTEALERVFEDDPAGVAQIAKKKRIMFYQRLSTSLECKQHFELAPSKLRIMRGELCVVGNFVPKDRLPAAKAANNFDISAAFTITRDFVNNKKLIVPSPAPSDRVVGSHAVHLLGDCEQLKGFWFQNTWGKDWGVDGGSCITYEFLDNFQVETVAVDHSYFKPSGGEKTVSILSYQGLDAIGRKTYCFSIYDATQDDRLGWTLVVIHEDRIVVEDLFVKPEHRRRGYGSWLAETLKELSAKLRIPLTLWVPWVDAGWENFEPLSALCNKLGLVLENTTVKWASYFASPAPRRQGDLKSIVAPPIPAYVKQSRTLEQERSINEKLAAVAEKDMMRRDRLRRLKAALPPSAITYDDEVELV